MFTLNQITNAVYATYLTNKYGFKVRRVSSSEDLKRLRIEYAQTLMDRLHISVQVKGGEKITGSGPYLLVSNHRSVIDPLIIELAREIAISLGIGWRKKSYIIRFFSVCLRVMREAYCLIEVRIR